MRTISPFEFVRRFKNGIVAREGRVVWFLGAGCSVSSGVEDAATLTMKWLAELKYLQTGDRDGLEDWAEATFPSFTRDDPAAAYIAVHEALFYTEQDQQSEQERLSVEGQPGFAYATLAQLLAHETWGERCNTVITTNFDDLAADALYLYSQRKPQVLTHESFDRHVQISDARPTIVKLYGDAHLGAEYLDGNRRLLRRDVKDRLRAQLTETTLVFVGYGGRDDCILDLLEGLPVGAPAGGIYWVNDKAPGKSLSGWLSERNAVWAQNESFDQLMYLMNREFELGHPRIDRFDQILQKYDDQYRALASKKARPVEASAESAEPTRPAEATVAVNSAPGDAGRSEAAATVSDPVKSTVGVELLPLTSEIEFGQITELFESEPVTPAEPAEAPAPASDAAEDDLADVFELRDVASDEDVAAATTPSEDGAGARTRIDALIAAAVKAMATDDQTGDAGRPTAEIPTIVPETDVVPAPSPANDQAKIKSSAPPLHGVTPQPLPDKPRSMPKLSPDAELIDVVDIPAPDARDLIVPKRLMRREEAVYLDAQFRAALTEHPRDASLLAKYAQFLTVGRRDHDGAEHYFNRAIDADPQNDEALRLFALFLTNVRRDEDRAEDCYRLAIRANFESTETMCSYAEFLWHSRGDFETAGECFQVAVDAAPRDGRALMRYARFLRVIQRNDDAAFALLKLAAASTASDPEPVIALARFNAARRENLDKAEAGFERAIEMAPASPTTLIAAAEFFTKYRNDPERAEALYNRALEADPASVEALLSYSEFLHVSRGDPAKAEKHLLRAIEVDPGDARTVLAHARFREEVLVDDEAADDTYRKAINLDPHDATALAWYGRFLQYARKKPDAAEDRLRKAVSMAPRNPLALRSFGWFLALERNDPEEGERYLRRAVSAAPADPEALADLASFLSGLADKQDEADEMFRRALASDPNNKRTLRRYARFSADGKGDPDAAEKLYRQVLDETPTDARALGGAAHSMFVQGRQQEGLALLERAFDAAMGDEPKRRSIDLLLELWFYRYAFDREFGRDAIKAAVWLVKEGARATRTDLDAVVARALTGGHDEPDLLRELARVARGDAGPERLDKFSVA